MNYLALSLLTAALTVCALVLKRPSKPRQDRSLGRSGAIVLTAIGAVLALGLAVKAVAAPDDLDALVRTVEAKAKSARADAQAWVDGQKGVGDQYASEAKALSEGNARQLQRGFTYMEPNLWKPDDRLEEDADAPSAGAIYVAVSLSMPPQALRQLASDAQKAGASVVVRGLVDGSFKKTLTLAKTIFDENSRSGVAIDPAVFRSYKVTSVPTFIVATEPLDQCNGVTCVSPPKPHDRLSGNISMREALRLLADKGDSATSVSRAALDRLGG